MDHPTRIRFLWVRSSNRFPFLPFLWITFRKKSRIPSLRCLSSEASRHHTSWHTKCPVWSPRKKKKKGGKTKTCLISIVRFGNMEEMLVAILSTLLVVALVPLYLWKRRQDSRSPNEREEEPQVCSPAPPTTVWLLSWLAFFWPMMISISSLRNPCLSESGSEGRNCGACYW